MPEMANYAAILFVLYAISIPFGQFTSMLAFGALICLIMRRGGPIQFNMAYLQRIAIDEAF